MNDSSNAKFKCMKKEVVAPFHALPPGCDSLEFQPAVACPTNYAVHSLTHRASHGLLHPPCSYGKEEGDGGMEIVIRF